MYNMFHAFCMCFLKLQYVCPAVEVAALAIYNGGIAATSYQLRQGRQRCACSNKHECSDLIKQRNSLAAKIACAVRLYSLRYNTASTPYIFFLYCYI